MDRNFSELDLQLVMFDLSETEEERDDNVNLNLPQFR